VMRWKLTRPLGKAGGNESGKAVFHTLRPPLGSSSPSSPATPGPVQVPFSMTSMTRTLFLALVLTACGDRSTGADLITDADIREYRLTEDALVKWQRIQLRSARDPELTVAGEAARKTPEGVDGRAASHMIRSFESSPAVAAVIAEEELTPREFVLVSFALYHAMAGQGSLQNPPELLTSQENLAFVGENLPTINRFYAEQVTAREEALDGAAPR
jgi:hypothetical protein